MTGAHRVLRLAVAAGTALLAGAAPAAALAQTTGGGPTAQSVLGSGSDTTMFMMHALDALYLASPGCAKVPTPSGPTPWLDFSCQSPDPTGTVTTENYSHDQAHEAYFLGSGNGLHQLCNQNTAGNAHIDFARSSKTPTSGNSCTGLHSVAYARDGIPWEAFDGGTTASGVHGMLNDGTAAHLPGNCGAVTCASLSQNCALAGAPPTCLSQAQLQGIYVSCTITNWSQVGGQNVPISIYTPQAGSGTRSAFEGFLAAGGGSVDSSHCIGFQQPNGGPITGLGNNPTISAHLIPENSNSGIPTNDRAGSIFPFSFGVWSTQVGTGNTVGAVLGAIDGVAASASSIADGSFPYARYLYNVYCTSACTGSPPSSTAAVNYVGETGWICKPAAGHTTNPATGHNYRTDIESAISANGFVPIISGPIGGGVSGSDFCRLFTT